MNIFVTHESPILCAAHLDDKRLNKMVLETAQLLCTAHHLRSGSRAKVLYAPTHRNHPVAVWVRATRGNYLWTYRLFAALAGEYNSRTGKVHKTWKDLNKVLANVPRRVKEGKRGPFVNCTPHKDVEDVIQAYRITLREKWYADKFAPKWGNRTTPPF